MENHALLHEHEWQFLEAFGLHHRFWILQADTIISTLFILALIFFLSLYVNRCLKNPQSLVRYVALQYVQALRDMLQQALYEVPRNHLAFIGSLFTFILLCNTVQIFPLLEEPTKDLNTTLALGLISFFYVQGYGLKVQGFKAYCLAYLEPFFVMLPLNIIGTLTTIISLSFRLFGNIFGGFIITTLYTNLLSGSVLLQTLGIITGLNLGMLCIFGIFEGIIQAFVFSMLTLTYLSIETVSHDEEESHD